MGLLGFTWVNLGQLGLRWVNLSHVRSTWVYLGQIESTWVYLGLLGSTWVYLGLHGSTRVYLGLHGFTWVFLGLFGSTCWMFYLKLCTTHSTSQNSMDCQTHVWSGPMEEQLKLCNHRAQATCSLIGADHNCVWQAMQYRKS